MVQEYLRPKTTHEAIVLSQQYGREARYIAGGTDVIVKIKDRQIRPEVLISLRSIPGLDDIRYEDGELRIGALTTHRELENIGSVQIRNVATLGGNIVNAVPSADGATPLIALGAKVRLLGPKGERLMALEEIFAGPGQTVLEPGEILCEFIIPRLPARTGGAYWKHMRRAAMELPILGVSVLVSLAEDMQTCVEARIGLGVMAPTPMRAKKAEAVLKGSRLTDEILEKAGKVAASESKPRDTFRGEAWYRREMVEVLIPRVAKVAMERTKQVS
jgi:CO/xanthine dehydrogenase FAD-binding subunit